MKLLRLTIVLNLLLWLAACATTTKLKESEVDKTLWSQQQQQLKKIQSWSIQGRIAVQTDDNGGQADYTWQQKNLTDYDIRLQAPLGAGTSWISSRAEGVSLKTSSGIELYDSDVDQLMLQVNGWPIPVSGLRYWVRGLPSSSSDYAVTEWNEAGLPAVIMQDGWRIEFRKRSLVAGQLLPHKLFITRQGKTAVDVRLIIREWVIN